MWKLQTLYLSNTTAMSYGPPRDITKCYSGFGRVSMVTDVIDDEQFILFTCLTLKACHMLHVGTSQGVIVILIWYRW